MICHVNRRRQLTTFLAIPASNLDQTQRINLIINPSDTSQNVVTLGRLSLVKVERLFTPQVLSKKKIQTSTEGVRGVQIRKEICTSLSNSIDALKSPRR